MCGILGVYFQDETKKADANILKNMCDIIQHRGLDDQGFFLKDNIGLGVRRLSVIDLTNGHQPIHNEDKTLWVILNGEIYNFPELKAELIKKGHIFYTETDTEVIVHLYEEEQESCIDKLNGMFAFAVFDVRKKRFFIARDRLGIKPLYYYNKDGSFIFASELKAILSFPGLTRQINAESLYNFFSFNYVPAPYTMFKDIKQLLAGHYLMATKEGIKITKYWDIHFDGYTEDDEDTVIEKTAHLLKQSVSRMLRSDVALGAFLSGGLDSSSLVSLITESFGKNLKTFSVGFEEDSYDETYFAKLASRHFQTEHRRVICKPNDLVQALPKIVWHADNLLADPSMLPLYLVSRLAKKHVTVCLSGDGGDELFMGYPTYTADILLRHYSKIPSFIRKKVIEKIINSLPASSRKLSFEYKAKKFIEGSRFPPDKAHYWWRTIFSDNEKKDLLSDDLLNAVGSADSYAYYSQYYNNFPKEILQLDRYLYADLKVWLTDNNLIRVDTMSMANSLEVRVPFLDHELVEFVTKVNPRLRMKGGKLKYLLKKAMYGKVPREIIQRKKSGWHVPLAQWFKSDLKAYCLESLANPKIIKSGIIKKEYIDIVLNEHFSSRRNNSFKIWGLLVFFQWYDTFC